MPKLRLPKHITDINPGVPEIVSTPRKKTEDKKYLFRDAWERYGTSNDWLEEYRFSERQFRFDFAWPIDDVKVAVEIDGGNWMVVDGKAVGRHGKNRDYEKLNIAASLGWRVMRFSPDMLKKDPIGCVEIVLKALNYNAD